MPVVTTIGGTKEPSLLLLDILFLLMTSSKTCKPVSVGVFLISYFFFRPFRQSSIRYLRLTIALEYSPPPRRPRVNVFLFVLDNYAVDVHFLI